MKRLIGMVAMLGVFAWVFLGPAGSSEAAPAARVDVQFASASAYFFGPLPPGVGQFGGYNAELLVDASIQRIQVGGQEYSDGWFYDTFRIYNPENGELVLACQGYVALEENDLTVAPDLSTAALDATIGQFWGAGETPNDDFICPTVPPSHVVLQWTPEGQAQTTKSKSRGGICDYRTVSQFANATAEGTSTAGAAGDIPVVGGSGFISYGESKARCS